MEPVSLIVGALLAGAASGGQETVAQAVKDAYAGLRALVARRFERERPQAQGVLVEVEKQVADQGVEQVDAGWRMVLSGELERAGAGADGEVLAAAQQLMALLDTAGSQAAKYTVDNRGSQGAVTGDGNTVHQSFGATPRPHPQGP